MTGPEAVEADEACCERARVRAAISELDELRSSDPAARSAHHAIELTRLTLECFWQRDA